MSRKSYQKNETTRITYRSSEHQMIETATTIVAGGSKIPYPRNKRESSLFPADLPNITAGQLNQCPLSTDV